MSSPSFQRWATGRASSEEKRRWDSWVESSVNNHRLAILAQQRITGLEGLLSADCGLSSIEDPAVFGMAEEREPDLSPEFLDEEWQKVVADIEAKSAVRKNDRKKATPSEPMPRRTSGSRRSRLPAMLMMAAALLLVTGFTVLMVYDQLSQPPQEQQVAEHVAIETITTGYSEKRTLHLSDGTRIVLAAGSSLSWREDWLTQPIRQVTLNSGEAYFIVEPREDRPYSAFEVITKDGRTSVLGTRFTVSTYEDGTQVVLQDGEVEILAEVGVDEVTRVTLTPGERARWRDSGEDISLSRVNPEVYTSWTTDELFFDDTPLAELVRRIERTYGFSVKVEDPALLERELSGSVDFRSLDGLISAVSSVLEIDIKRENNQILITQS